MYGLPYRNAKRVLGFVLALFTAAMCLSMPHPAAAADGANGAAASDKGGKRFAVVWRIVGEVTASTGESGRIRKLRVGDLVFVGESVRATPSGEAVLKTDDAGWLAVRPGAVFVAERFVAEGRPNDEFAVRIVVGALRMITGWVGRSNRDGHRVFTPTATIGIRGTDHEPYVLTAELADTLSEPAGTYDKVNRGGTTLDSKGNRLDVDAGKVGFARAARTSRTRGLMTLLLPTLLDKVPTFYVPGQFDAELDQLSQASDDEAQRLMEARRKLPASKASARPSPAAAAASSKAVTPAGSATPGASRAGAPADPCGVSRVARAWLTQCDAAIAKHRAEAVMRLFAPDVAVRATVRNQDGSTTTLELGRDEFAQSVAAAVQGLSDFRQRRLSIEARPLVAGACGQIEAKSIVIEQGKRQGTPYRFESVETYLLEMRAGKWLGTRAETTQR